jgi:tetratricopeptide (TPR) repeat protein
MYALFVLGRMDEAIRVARDAQTAAGDDRSVAANTAIVSPYAWLLMMRGLIVDWTGDFADAERCLQAALSAAREGKDFETEAWTRMICVGHCELTGDAEHALAHARQAVDLVERAGGAFSRGLAQQYLGVAHILRAEWDEAVHALELARALHTAGRPGWEEEPLVVAMLARARLGQGEVAAARALADEAVRLAVLGRTATWELHARHQRARALLAGRDADRRPEAERELRRALDVAVEIGAHAFEPRLRATLAEVGSATERGPALHRELAEAHRGGASALRSV